MVSVSINDESFSDGDAARLSAFSELKSLSLMCPRLTAEGIEYACQRRAQFIEIAIVGDEVDDRLVERLGVLPRVRSVTLHSSKVTDAAVETLARYPQLERLDVTGASLTDSALPVLASASQLSELWLHQTDVSVEGAAEFQADHPDVHVIGDSGQCRAQFDNCATRSSE